MLNSSITPSGNIIEAPELGTKNKILAPNGVRYREVPLCICMYTVDVHTNTRMSSNLEYMEDCRVVSQSIVQQFGLA